MKTIILIISQILISFLVFGQPPCGSSPAAGNTCATATPICDLNGYCGNTSSSYTVNSWNSSCGFLGLLNCGLTGEFCGSIENNSFLSFVASASTITFDCWVYNSTTNQGIQIMIFSANNCSGNVTSYSCDELAPSPNAQTVTASGLTPGNTYYIMIDGFAGDVCDYTFAANSGIQIPVDVSPITSNICPGESVNLTATGGNGTYTWNASPDLNNTSGATVIATPPSVPGTYTYTANSSTGNPLCPSSTFATATVIVDNCGCTVTASNSGNLCTNSNLSANLFASFNSGATYVWTGPNGFSSTDQNPINVSIPSAPGDYEFTVEMTLNGSTCLSTTTITVFPLPIVNAGNYGPYCSDNAPINLLGTPTGGTYSGFGVNSNTFDVSSGTQTIQYNYTDLNGCSNNSSTIITVNQLPIVDAGIDQSICESIGSITLTGTPLGGTFSGTGIVGNLFNSISGTQTVQYEYTDGNGCSNSDFLTITVEPNPSVNAGTYSNVCENSTLINLVGTPAGGTFSGIGVSGNTFDPMQGTQTITYNYTSAGNCSNSDNTTIIVNPLPIVDAGTYTDLCEDAAVVNLVGSPTGGLFSGTGVTGSTFNPSQGTQTITYTYTDGNGCTNTDNKTITVHSLPNVNAGNDLTICENQAVVLSGSGASSYTWSNGVIDNQSFTPNVGSITYTVTGTDSNGCTGTDDITVTVIDMPEADAIADSTTGFPGLTVNFTNNSSVVPTYLWSFGNGATGQTTSIGTTPNTTYNEPGTYTMVLTATNGTCTDYDTVQIIILEYPEPIIVVPNVFTPNNDGSNEFFFIDAQYTKSIQYIIVNRWGNLIFENEGVNPTWNGTNKSGNPVEEGVYFLKYEIIGLDENTYTGHGSVTLIRN